MYKIKYLIRIAVRFIILVFFNTVLRFFLYKKNRNCKYNVSICAIFKNEAPFLKEWIEYHLMIGVDHFYMYDNNSDDNFYEILLPYINAGIVELKQWKDNNAQMSAYKDFYQNKRQETSWVSFLDIDEFICLRNVFYSGDWKNNFSHNLRCNNISKWLESYEKYPGVMIYFKMFGTSGVEVHDFSKLVVEQYTVSWPGLYKIGKCFINTQYDIAYYDSLTHHCPAMGLKFMGLKVVVHPVNVFKLFVDYNIHFSWLFNDNKASAQINHYWSKAWNIYNKQVLMTDVYFKENPKKDIDYFYYHEEHNVSSDYTIFKYLIQLKARMGIISLENFK